MGALIASLEKGYPALEESATRTEFLPNAIRFIIFQIRYNLEIRNAILIVVEDKMKKESTSLGPGKITG